MDKRKQTLFPDTVVVFKKDNTFQDDDSGIEITYTYEAKFVRRKANEDDAIWPELRDEEQDIEQWFLNSSDIIEIKEIKAFGLTYPGNDNMKGNMDNIRQSLYNLGINIMTMVEHEFKEFVEDTFVSGYYVERWLSIENPHEAKEPFISEWKPPRSELKDLMKLTKNPVQRKWIQDAVEHIDYDDDADICNMVAAFMKLAVELHRIYILGSGRGDDENLRDMYIRAYQDWPQGNK